LTMMFNGVRGALAADDALSDLGAECKFRVQETPERKVRAVHIEAERSQDQTMLLFEG
jgi:hypothetical protein